MNDLNGLDWSASGTSNKKPANPSNANYYQTFRSSPPVTTASKPSPFANLTSTNSGSQIPKTSSPDSFSNLVSFGSSKTTTLSLQEQQQRLQAEKQKKEAEKRKQYEAAYGSGQFWDGLGSRNGLSGSSTPISRGSTPATTTMNTSFNSLNHPNIPSSSGKAAVSSDDDDLFAAFNADTKVDNASHYPPPPSNKPDFTDPSSWQQPSSFKSSNVSSPSVAVDSGYSGLGNDDDPFGLGTMSKNASHPAASATDDDDFLGDLGKPVEEVRKVKAPSPVREPQRTESPRMPAESDDPFDKAVNELVDMGFTAENSRRALTESGSGLNIQAAVGWLLEDAHRQAKEKAQGRTQSAARDRGESPSTYQRDSSTSRSRREAGLARDNGYSAESSRNQSRSPANGEVDLSKAAAAVGSNLFKTANSLWKTSQKQVRKAVADFQAEGDSSQPRWMRDSGESSRPEKPPRPDASMTDEAMLLEGGSRPAPRRSKHTTESQSPQPPFSSREQSPAPNLPSRPKWQQPADPRSRLTKQASEEQSAQAYISPARRKKATPQPREEPEADLLFGASQPTKPPVASHPTPPARSYPLPATKATPVPSKPSTPITIRAKAPPRQIPPVSAAILKNSTQHRLAGTAHFKRGDYAAAHTSYSSSLMGIPDKHPIAVILLCNRSLTALKIGEPRTAVADADKALDIIGVSRGENEVIDLSGQGNPDEKKDMKEFWGKALMRKAEALEQMEKWKDAGVVWREAVEAGVGGATSIQGRQRCERALAPKPPPSKASTPKPAPPKPKPSALSDLAPPSTQSTAAVSRLREANAAAEKAEDEKFALTDAVDAKILRWREGRADNIRALLGALDAVLWEGSGWKKIGMHELLVNNKVKIHYMKAIAKVHPDKLPQTATTEMKMISASVFATLNEAWDKFKIENGM